MQAKQDAAIRCEEEQERRSIHECEDVFGRERALVEHKGGREEERSFIHECEDGFQPCAPTCYRHKCGRYVNASEKQMLKQTLALPTWFVVLLEHRRYEEGGGGERLIKELKRQANSLPSGFGRRAPRPFLS